MSVARHISELPISRMSCFFTSENDNDYKSSDEGEEFEDEDIDKMLDGKIGSNDEKQYEEKTKLLLKGIAKD